MVSRCRAIAFVSGNLPHSKAVEVGDAVLDALRQLGVRPMFPSQVCRSADRLLALLANFYLELAMQKVNISAGTVDAAEEITTLELSLS